MSIIKFIKEVNLEDYTLIIPSVSVANVPQLTVDLIIVNYDLQRTGIIWHPAIIPSVGSDPFSLESTEVTTACELFTNEDLKLAVIQMRSGIERQFAQAFFDLLLSTISSWKIKQVMLLTSTFAHEMHDVKSSVFRFISKNASTFPENTIENIGILRGTQEEFEQMSGTGYALKLYKMATTSTKLNISVLVKYSSEGDNRPDAMQMLSVINQLGSFKPSWTWDCILKTIKFPISWDHIFGNPPPMGIY